MKHIYTSVDLGTDSIKVVVCELYKNKLNLLAASSEKSEGIKKGLITDVEKAKASLKRAISSVESMLGITIKQVIASVPSYFLDCTMIKGSTTIPKNINGEDETEDGIIDGNDVTRVLSSAIQSYDLKEREMVSVLPIDFLVNGKDYVKDPKGLTGEALSTRAIMVSTPKKNIYSVVQLFMSLGIEVVDITINAIGDAYAFKNRDMDASVGAIINIGEETTMISLYNKGIIVKHSMLQLGGKNIDNDIAYIYKLTNDDARKIKEKFALASKNHASQYEFMEFHNTYGEMIRVNQFEASEIIESRLQEILTLAKKEIRTLTNRNVDYVLVTGGTSNIAGFSYIAKEVFGNIAKIGNVKLIGIRNNKYSSAVGNIAYFVSKLKLKGKEYSMVSTDMEDTLVQVESSNGNYDSMLGKVFGFFFSE
ncbi:MAG: cell division protein FtsA [Firmicutes bacterium]|nr:cell division protein FtsA [Bacillota bacterium]